MQSDLEVGAGGVVSVAAITLDCRGVAGLTLRSSGEWEETDGEGLEDWAVVVVG